MILINQVYKIRNERLRVLWIEKDFAYVISIDKNEFPYKEKVETIMGNDSEIVDFNDEIHYKVPEAYLEKRDELWNRMHPILQKEPDIFIKSERNELVRRYSSEIGFSEKHIKNLMKRYWRGGKSINTLIPSYYRCGIKKELPTINSPKRGRPSKYGSEGVNVDAKWISVFQKAIEKYYYARAKNSKVMTYELMRRDYYEKYPEYSEDFPTFSQFSYWSNKFLKNKAEIISRFSSKHYLKNHRPLLNGIDGDINGPGFMEIDAHKADVYLVSIFSRNIVIGRPVVYVCMDRFSRMVTGLYVGLEDGSYSGAMMALYSTSRNKRELCSEYGIEIAEAEWPAQCLPKRLLADRGEIEGNRIDNLIESLGIEVSLTASYRGDSKGLVEGFFSILNKYVLSLLPGFIDTEKRERGDWDYRLDSKLNIKEYTAILIRAVLHYNKTYLSNYQRTHEMIEDNVIPTPIELWNWGIKNYGNDIRYAEQSVQLALLPKGKAYVTRYGIKYKSLLYASERMIKEGLFEKDNSSKEIEFWYDPRTVSYIYARNLHGQIEKCMLLPRSKRYEDASEDEYIKLIEDEKKMKHEYLEKNKNNRAELIKDITDIVKSASGIVNLPKSERKKMIKNISDNREAERRKIRESEEFDNVDIISED